MVKLTPSNRLDVTSRRLYVVAVVLVVLNAPFAAFATAVLVDHAPTASAGTPAALTMSATAILFTVVGAVIVLRRNRGIRRFAEPIALDGDAVISSRPAKAVAREIDAARQVALGSRCIWLAIAITVLMYGLTMTGGISVGYFSGVDH